ncbi:Na(+)/H(+) antiporter subunit B [Novipirellula sp.]|uniref:Na(+)/H(+) antiporter subunit B n=1 Tax=Novipirellula sp. TaxID=2795430 RepID=UPI0035645CE8
MNSLLWILDITLCGSLLWLAWQTLATSDLFKAIVLFIVLGLVMALAWARLDAPDIALAEAAIGAGLTGALLLSTLTAITKRPGPRTPPETMDADT